MTEDKLPTPRAEGEGALTARQQRGRVEVAARWLVRGALGVGVALTVVELVADAIVGVKHWYGPFLLSMVIGGWGVKRIVLAPLLRELRGGGVPEVERPPGDPVRASLIARDDALVLSVRRRAKLFDAFIRTLVGALLIGVTCFILFIITPRELIASLQGFGFALESLFQIGYLLALCVLLLCLAISPFVLAGVGVSKLNEERRIRELRAEVDRAEVRGGLTDADAAEDSSRGAISVAHEQGALEIVDEAAHDT